MVQTKPRVDQVKKLNMLISLHKGYGMGDCVQMSAVLKHVKKHRPNWSVDYRADEGRHCVGRGLVDATFAYGRPYPRDYYDAEILICLYDTWANFHDRPNTRVSSCLREQFDIEWDAECGSYSVKVSSNAEKVARLFTAPNMKTGTRSHERSGVVAFHYQGDSSPDKKNLTHEQASGVCAEIEKLGRTPLLMDWRNTSPLGRAGVVRTTGKLPTSLEWGGDAEINCAIIGQCSAFVGIDSGPSKCASATDTPALVVWTGHHPAQFHDPAPNTTHLVPRGYHGLYPVCGDAAVIKWFEEHYSVRYYERDPVAQVRDWLGEILA